MSYQLIVSLNSFIRVQLPQISPLEILSIPDLLDKEQIPNHMCHTLWSFVDWIMRWLGFFDLIFQHTSTPFIRV